MRNTSSDSRHGNEARSLEAPSSGLARSRAGADARGAAAACAALLMVSTTLGCNFAQVDPEARANRDDPASAARASASLGGGPGPAVLHSMSVSGWYEGGYSESTVSRDGRWLYWTAAGNPHLLDLATGTLQQPTELGTATQLDQNTLAFWPLRSPGWQRLTADVTSEERGGDLPPTFGPESRNARWSADGKAVAWIETTSEEFQVVLRRGDGEPSRRGLRGAARGMVWDSAGDRLYILVQNGDGSCSLWQQQAVESLELIAESLDAPPFWTSIAWLDEPPRVVLALASSTAPDAEARHDPAADRDLDLWSVRVADGAVEFVAGAPRADDFSPAVGGGRLFWTRNDLSQEIVRLPTAGGPVQVLVDDAHLPEWSPTGDQLAFSRGDWRLADMALNLDSWSAQVDGDGRIGAPSPLVVGWHEDFTPSWSPDGRWLAYHSHRSTHPVSAYSEAGSTDDVFLRRVGAPPDQELRLTDFGVEVGRADWSPDSQWLAFASHRHGGQGSAAWLVQIDPQTGEALDRLELESPPDVVGVDRVVFGPGGQIVQITTGDRPGERTLWFQNDRSSAARKLADFRSSTLADVDWSPGGEHLVYTALWGERMALWRIAVDVDSAAAPTTPFAADPAADLLHPSLSPDGRWIAATRVRWRKSLLSQPIRQPSGQPSESLSAGL